MATPEETANELVHDEKPEPMATGEVKVKKEVKLEEDVSINIKPNPKQLEVHHAVNPKVKLDVLVDDKIRVLTKEAASKRCLECLGRIRTIMNPQIANFPECEEWNEKGKDIQDHEGIPRVLVGVVGCTGAGKSSLINAILDEESIVPCNAMKAHTAVAVEIAWNSSDDPAEVCRAEIEFISLQDWQEEVAFLLKEIKARPDADQSIIDSDAEASIAYSKVAAVYPKVSLASLAKTTQKQLMKTRVLTDILGKTTHIQATSVENISRLINSYIASSDTDSGNEPMYWPLIKVVKIFAKIDILKTGLVLVDLPGLGDSNSARASVAEGYMRHLNHMWIVENIVRAVDSKIASNLSGRKLQRQLSMDGRYNDSFITFVTTWADVIPTQSVIDSLKLDSSVLQKELTKESQLNESIDQLEAQLSMLKQERRKSRKKSENSSPSNLENRKRKRDEDEDPRASETKSLKRELSKLKKELNKLKSEVKAVCVRQRNLWVVQRMQQQFNHGRKESQRDMAGDDEPAVSISNTHGIAQTNMNVKTGRADTRADSKVRTFCVSSNVYQQLCGRMKREDPSPAFPTINHTGIPPLKEFAETCTFPERERNADRILNEFNLLKWSIRSWAEGKEAPQLSKEQVEKLSGEADDFYKELQKTTARIGKNSMSRIRTAVKSKIDVGLIKSVEASTVTALIEVEKIRMSDIHSGQWKAIVRRKGIPYKDFDWVETFTEPFAMSFAAPWKLVFEVKIPEILHQYSLSIIEALSEFRTSLAKSADGICGEHPPMQYLLAQLPLLEDLVKERVAVALEYSEECAKDANREAAPVIKLALEPIYDALFEITGKGMLNRSKNALCNFIKENATEMYTKARETILKALKKMNVALNLKFNLIARNVEGKLYKDIKAMLAMMNREDLPERMENKKQAFQSAINFELDELEAAWAKLVNDPVNDLRAKNPLERIEGIVDCSDDATDSESDESSESDSDSDNSDTDPDGSDSGGEVDDL